LAEGFRYAFGFPPIRALILLLGLVSLMGMPLSVLLPVYATDVLKGDATLFGFLTGATGCGALAAALYLASRETVLGLGVWMTWATGLFGAAMIAFAASRSVPLSLVLLALAGFFMMFQMASSNMLLQTIVDEDKRGRVMSLYTMAFMGMAPCGSLMAGSIAEHLGPGAALDIAGVSCIAGAAVFAVALPGLREHVRPIYVRHGILPAAALAVQATAELKTPPQET
jgi:MFS family permease